MQTLAGVGRGELPVAAILGSNKGLCSLRNGCCAISDGNVLRNRRQIGAIERTANSVRRFADEYHFITIFQFAGRCHLGEGLKDRSVANDGHFQRHIFVIGIDTGCLVVFAVVVRQTQRGRVGAGLDGIEIHFSLLYTMPVGGTVSIQPSVACPEDALRIIHYFYADAPIGDSYRIERNLEGVHQLFFAIDVLGSEINACGRTYCRRKTHRTNQ